MRQFYSITELTREFGVSTRTLRHYEAEGLLSPLRRGRHRLYSVADRTRVKLILRGKRIGFSLAEIRDIVSMYDEAPGEVGQLRLLLDKIAARRAVLQQKRRDIEQTLRDMEDVEAGCHEHLKKLGAEP